MVTRLKKVGKAKTAVATAFSILLEVLLTVTMKSFTVIGSSFTSN